MMEKSLSVLILDFCLICKAGVFDSFSDNFDLSGVSHVLGLMFCYGCALGSMSVQLCTKMMFGLY